MNKSILFLCVNYNSYDELNNYLFSIEKAYTNYKDELKIDVLVADNTVDGHGLIDYSELKSVTVDLKPYHENLGYLGAIMRLINDKGAESVKSYDFVIMSNVDLLLTETFFMSLLSAGINISKVGWVAPKIISLAENKDRNPKILKRPSKERLEKILVMFKYPILYRIYYDFIYKLRNKKLQTISDNRIYAGHGSMMIFTNAFMLENIAFRFPCFLFGEELFFGELVRLSNLDVIYVPEIIVHDIDHVSTSKLKRSNYCKMNYESLKELIKIYWNE